MDAAVLNEDGWAGWPSASRPGPWRRVTGWMVILGADRASPLTICKRVDIYTKQRFSAARTDLTLDLYCWQANQLIMLCF